jgi:hypothetical protein
MDFLKNHNTSPHIATNPHNVSVIPLSNRSETTQIKHLLYLAAYGKTVLTAKELRGRKGKHARTNKI